MKILRKINEFKDKWEKAEFFIDDIQEFSWAIQDKYDADMKISYNEATESIDLSYIGVPDDKQKQGIGSKMMDEVCKYADKYKLDIKLHANGDLGTDVNVLKKFYKKHGFIDKNKSVKGVGDLMIRIHESIRINEQLKSLEKIKNSRCHYFAYGSNMNSQQMLKRCPSAVFIKTGKLYDYKLIFSIYSNSYKAGVACIIPESESHVEGVIWELDKLDIIALDSYEGSKYNRIILNINDFQSFVYVANGDQIGNYPPSEKYLKIIEDGATEHGLKFDRSMIFEADTDRIELSDGLLRKYNDMWKNHTFSKYQKNEFFIDLMSKANSDKELTPRQKEELEYLLYKGKSMYDDGRHRKSGNGINPMR